MFKHLTTGLMALSLAISLTVPSSLVSAQTQSPYWDNSSGDSSYYSPSNSGQGSYGSQQGTYGNQNSYGAPNAQNNYGNQGSYGNQNNYGGGYNAQQSQGGYNNNPYGNQTQLQGRVSTAPAGTPMTTRTSTYLSSETAHIGDPVSVNLAYDLAMGGSVVLPAGSVIQGQVVSAVPARRTGRHGQLQIRFNRAALPDGRQVPLSARLVTEDGSGIIKGGTRVDRAKSAAKNTIGGAALGAASGALIGALSGGGRADDYLARGAVIGAAGGLGRTAYKRGEPAELRPGTELQLMLDQPLTVHSSNGGGYGAQPYGNSGGYAPY